jgi:hypothetical protein
MCEEYNMVNVNYGDWMRCRTFLLRKKIINGSTFPFLRSRAFGIPLNTSEKMVTVTEPKRRIKILLFRTSYRGDLRQEKIVSEPTETLR